MSNATQAQTESTQVEGQATALPGFAAQQAKQVIVLTGDVLTTTGALLTSALSLVAALAWNNFIEAWLPTVHFLNRGGTVIKDLIYAVSATLIAVLAVTLISRVRKRIRGHNLLTS
jgi:hypothetical protein